MDHAVNVDQLRAFPPLAEVSEAGLERVAACAAELEAKKGQVIAVPGDPGSGMFVIQDGTVTVELRSGRLELGPGDFFGEVALLVDDGTRIGPLRATTPVACLSIPREGLLPLVVA